MIIEVFLLLPLYIILFVKWWRFWHLIKIMADAENILNNEEFFGDAIEILKYRVVQHKKWQYLRDVISKGKAYLLRKKEQWPQEKADTARDENINKRYAVYKQCELNELDEKNGKEIGKHVINLYSAGISQVFKIKNVKKLQPDIENNPMIKDQMSSLGCLLVRNLGNFLARFSCWSYSEKHRHQPWKKFWKWGLCKLINRQTPKKDFSEFSIKGWDTKF